MWNSVRGIKTLLWGSFKHKVSCYSFSGFSPQTFFGSSWEKLEARQETRKNLSSVSPMEGNKHHCDRKVEKPCLHPLPLKTKSFKLLWEKHKKLWPQNTAEDLFQLQVKNGRKNGRQVRNYPGYRLLIDFPGRGRISEKHLLLSPRHRVWLRLKLDQDDQEGPCPKNKASKYKVSTNSSRLPVEGQEQWDLLWGKSTGEA